MHAVPHLEEVKPRLRGWLHTVGAPLTLVAGAVLVARSPGPVRLGTAAFVASAVVLFTVSALYHRGAWSDPVRTWLRRLDHANIFLHIAGTYTAFALVLLEPGRVTRLLTIVWLAAALGAVFRICWVDAPRWLHTPVYVLVGSVALLFAADFTADGEPLPVTLMLTGGGLYLLGALVYGIQRPNPLPRWFGFHEVFHTFTMVAFATHYVGLTVGLSPVATSLT